MEKNVKKIANVSNGLQVIIAVKLKEDVWIVNLVIMEQIAKIDVIQPVKQIYVVRLNQVISRNQIWN